MNIDYCQVCGSNNVYVKETYGYFFVECEDCGAHGPICSTEEEAILRWNSGEIEKE